MAALRVREDSTLGQLTMQSPLLPRLGSILSTLGWLGFFAIFFALPFLLGRGVDWGSMIVLAVVLLLSLGSLLWTVLITTTVTIDRASRMVTNTTGILGMPIRSSALTFGDLKNIQVEYYRQSSGRYSHDAWRVLAIDKNGKRLALNWDGKQSEMIDLAQKVSALTGAPLLDTSAKPISTVRQFLEQLRGESGEEPAEAQPLEPALTDANAPPPVAVPWGMPAAEPTLTQEPMPTPPEVATVPESMSLTDLRSLTSGELEQRVQADAMDTDSREALAHKYHLRGQTQRAIALYQEVLRLDPTNARVQNDLGVALQQRGKRAEAEGAYRRAAALDPFFSTAHLNLAMLLRSMNRAAEASQEFFLARQNARGEEETRAAEAASTGARMEPQLSKT